MKCLHCSATLKRFEQARGVVYQCPDCLGYLAVESGLAFIEQAGGPSRAGDEEAAPGQAPGAGETGPRCPNCLVGPMTRRRAIVKMRPDNPMAFDACRRCGSIWLADGELVRLRIDFAAAAKAIDDLNVKTRIERLSLEEQERLDKQIAELPLPKGFLGGVLSDLVHDPRLLVGLLAAAAIVSLLVCLYFAVQQ